MVGMIATESILGDYVVLDTDFLSVYTGLIEQEAP